MSGGMFPRIANVSISGGWAYAPSGGTWWVFSNADIVGNISRSMPGGSQIVYYASMEDSFKNRILCIKIA